MALRSPGVEINIIDESQYIAAALGPTPLIIAATAENKQNASNTGIAQGTLASNAGKMQLVASQRELTSLFGVPNFTKVSGAVQQGGELNEYGLLAAYSFLGVADGAYVMRPDIDLNQLVASATPPTGNVAAGTYWLDLAATAWGLLEWDAGDQAFSVVAPHLITSNTNLDVSGIPKATFGFAGDYAIVFVDASNDPLTSVKTYYKGARPDRSNNWVQLGTDNWKSSSPTIVISQYAASASFQINSESVGTQTIGSGSSVSDLVNAINGTALNTVLTAIAVGSNTVNIYSRENLTVTAGSTALGLAAGTYGRPFLQQSKHTVVPAFKTSSVVPRPTGSVWFKTTSPNNGANIVVKRFSANGDWISVATPLYAGGNGVNDNDDALANLTADGVTASTISANSLYMRYDNDPATTNFWEVELLKWTKSALSVTSSAAVAVPASNPVSGSTFFVTIAGDSYTVTQSGAGLDELAVAFTNANIPNMQLTVNSNNTVTITNVDGHDFYLTNATNNPLTAINIAEGLYSNWNSLVYSASVSEPTSTPANGELWFNSVLDEVDIMVNDGTDWVGYRSYYASTDPLGPIVSASEPTTQNDGTTALVVNDLWIDTSDLENYPIIKRYTALGNWEVIDKTDQTTENGVVFADARSNVDGSSTGSALISDMLTSDYVDDDTPLPENYPEGMLLFNLRRSGYNVKEYRVNYFPTSSNPNRWVSKVTVSETGMPYMGRKSQRRVVVEAMAAAVSSSLEARKEQYSFNLIAAPGYPELADEMITLNVDRKGTAFVLVDPPFRLRPTANDLVNWANNAAGATGTGEDGLVTANEYTATYYPHGLTSDLSGSNVMVPASHMLMRLIALNDQVAYPWFAPAGLRRGVVDNASSVGYLDAQGNFQVALLGQGERDAMYLNRLNPISVQPTTGTIVVFGQKTLSTQTTALDRVNVARLVVYIRSALEDLVKPFLFEPNDTVTRNQAKQKIETFLNELAAQRALYDFLVVCDLSNNTPERIDRNELWIDIAVKPVKAVEFIYIPVRVVNTGAIL